MDEIKLTTAQRTQISTILSRRANEIAGYRGDNKDKFASPEYKGMPASVDYALELEINRLRKLAALVAPPKTPEPDDE